MTPKKDRVEYSPHTRTRIATAYNLGQTARVIAFKEGVPQGSVAGIVARYNKQKSATSKARPGRPKVLAGVNKSTILRALRVDPFVSTTELKKTLGVDCSNQTLLNHLRQHDIHHFKILERSSLNPEIITERWKFAKAPVDDTKKSKVTKAKAAKRS